MATIGSLLTFSVGFILAKYFQELEEGLEEKKGGASANTAIPEASISDDNVGVTLSPVTADDIKATPAATDEGQRQALADHPPVHPRASPALGPTSEPLRNETHRRVSATQRTRGPSHGSDTRAPPRCKYSE